MDAFSGIFYEILIGGMSLSLMILIHEFGHFVAAKRAGVVVERFSLGFGPRLFGVVRNGTDYCIRALFFGGYVKMKGEYSEEEGVNEPDSYPGAPVSKRIMIAIAGPFMNVLFGVLAFSIAYSVGVPKSDYSPEVGYVYPNSRAAEAGIQPGDLILSIDGNRVSTWDQVRENVMVHPNEEITIEISRNGKKMTIIAVPEEVKQEGMGKIGRLGMIQVIEPIVRSISPDSPAASLDLQPGDRIVSVDGVPVSHFMEMVDIASAKGGQPLLLGIERDGKVHTVEITPEFDEAGELVGMGGIIFGKEIDIEKYNPVEAIGIGARESVLAIGKTVGFLKKLVFHEISPKYVSGPLGIVQITASIFRVGFTGFLFMLGFLSVNLAVVNLLPIPVADGGQIVFFLVEAIVGKPINRRVQMAILQASVILVILLFLYVTFNDVVRIFG